MSAPGDGFLREALFNGNGIAKRLIVALVVFSSLITAVVTAVELYFEYRRDLRQIDSAFEFVGESYLPSLVETVWVSDSAQVQTQLNGLLRLPDVEFIGVLVDGRLRWSAGAEQSRRTRSSEVALVRQHRGAPLAIGSVRIVASVDRVIERMWDRLLVILVGNGVKTLLVAAFLLLVFQWLVTRHLTTIAAFVRAFSPASSQGEQVRLARPDHGRWRPDVLDTVTGAINDLSRRLAATQASERAGEARFRAIVEAQDDAVCRWLPDARLTYTNARYRELFGLTEASAAGRRWLEFVPDDEREQIAAFIEQLAGAPRRVAYEHSATTADGRELWFSWVDVPLFDAGGTLVEFQSVGRDITERRHAEQQLRELNESLEQRVVERTAELQRALARAEHASRAKSEFLSRMSHELRTPLNAISGFAQVIELAGPTDQQRRWVREIRTAGDHLLQLIDELLDLSRIEAGRMTLSLEPLEVQPVVREALAFVQPALGARALTVELLEPCAESGRVHADRVRLRQILVNLLSNAIKYNRPGGRVTVGCAPLGDDRVRVSIRDTGVGLSPDQIERLFQPFERLGADAAGIQGTGIGLALSRQLARLMDGDIGVTSTPQVGSTFWIDLPRAGAAAAAAASVSSADAARAPLAGKVLCVEDNPANLLLVQALLGQHPGIRLTTAGDGLAGLAAARAEKPDAILLDLHMPGVDGFEVLRQLRADPATRSIPAIALTADAMPEEVERGLAAGFVRYLTKPLWLDDLIDALAQVLPSGRKP